MSGLMRMKDTFSVRKEVGTHTISVSFLGKVHSGRIERDRLHRPPALRRAPSFSPPPARGEVRVRIC